MRDTRMQDHQHDGAFDTETDGLLRVALAARPEPATDVDFAARAMAAASALTLDALPSPARAAAWPLWAAAVAIVAVVVFGIVRLMALSGEVAADAMSSASSTTSGDTVSLLPVGGAVLVAAIAWAVARSAFTPPEPTLATAFG